MSHLFKHIIKQQKRVFSSSLPTFVDHYSILGVKMSSNLKEIQMSYHRLAKKLHPDANRHRNTTQQFAEINVAYKILTSPMLRKKYDQTFHKMKQRHEINEKMRTRVQYEFNNHYKKSEEQRRRNKRRSAGDIGSDRDMNWKAHSEDLYSVYWTDALDAWHLEHHVYLEQVDPWKLKSESP